MNRLIRHLPLFCLLLPLAACGGKNEEAQQQAVQALIDRTLSELVFVEGGTFWMGDYLHGLYPGNEGEPQWWSMGSDNKVQHQVTLDSFHIQKHEVTYDEFDTYTKATQQPLLRERSLRGKRPFRQPNRPANANWHQARAYCLWLGEQTGLPFDLPTEAQWEYAARSRGQWVGVATDDGYPDFGRNLPNFERYPHDVCTYPPNPLGLCDMSANVAEWVLDWYATDYYLYSPQKNPQGPPSGELKVTRGGSIMTDPHLAWNAYRRDASNPEKGLYIHGFRCVVNTAEPIPQAHIPPDDAEVKHRLARGLLPPIPPPGSNNIILPDESTRCASCPHNWRQRPWRDK